MLNKLWPVTELFEIYFCHIQLYSYQQSNIKGTQRVPHMGPHGEYPRFYKYPPPWKVSPCNMNSFNVPFKVNQCYMKSKYRKSEPIKLLKSSYSILWCSIIPDNGLSWENSNWSMKAFLKLIAQKWPKFPRSNCRCCFENQYISLKIFNIFKETWSQSLSWSVLCQMKNNVENLCSSVWRFWDTRYSSNK